MLSGSTDTFFDLMVRLDLRSVGLTRGAAALDATLVRFGGGMATEVIVSRP